MQGGKKALKIFIILQIIATGYILLTSKIISNRAEKKVVDIIYDSVVGWDDRGQALVSKINKREIKLTSTIDDKLSARLAGRILLQAESSGEAWYLNPLDKKRYFLGRPQEAWVIIKKLGVELPAGELLDYLYFAKTLPKNLEGRFVWAKNNPKEIYYFYPDRDKPLLLKESEDSLELLQPISIGVSNENIRKITVGEI